MFRTRRAEDAGLTASSASAAGGGTETLLVVENEAPIRSLLSQGLERLGYTVLSAESGDVALALVQQHTGPIALVITDVVMPDMSGPELVRRLGAARPGLRTLFMSGYADDALGAENELPADVNFIQKPFSPTALARRVREILDRAQSML